MKFETSVLLGALLLLSLTAMVFAAGLSGSVTVVATPTPEPTAPPSGGGGGGGGGDFGNGPIFGAPHNVPTPTPEAQLSGPSENKEFMVFVPSLAYVGSEVTVRIRDRKTSLPLEDVIVRIYRNGAYANILLHTDATGNVQFTPLETGDYTYKGEKSGWTQFNNPDTLVVTLPQTQLEGTPPAPTTGFFTALSGNWWLILLLLGAAYASYRQYLVGKGKK